MAESQVKTEGQTIDPPRFVWLRRGAIGFILLLLTLVVLRLWWGHEANRRIADLARVAHARGEPFYPEEFRQPPVPDAENAAILIQAASDQVPVSRASYPNLENGEHAPPLESELPALETFVAGLRSPMKLVHAARSLPRAEWNAIPSVSNSLPNLSGVPSLRHAIIASAMLERARAHDGLVIERIQDELAFANILDRANAEIVLSFMAAGTSNFCTEFIRTSAMDLAISRKPGPDATPDQVRALIATLLDERELNDGAVRAFYGERATTIEELPQLEASAGWPMRWLLKPMYEMDAARVCEVRSSEAESLRQATWPAAHAKIKPLRSGSESILEILSHPLEDLGIPKDHLVQIHFQMLANRHIAAIMLALRLYEVDHHGNLPESLSQLVPDYLPAIPRDPYDPAGGPIQYLPHRTPPAIYSVGLNGKDDHGSKKIVVRDFQSDQAWQGEDAVFSLVPQPRISPPQTQSSN